jgi:hexosaminidase
VIFSGEDSTLLAGNGSISNVTLVASGNPFTLNYSLSLNTWTKASLIGRGDATYFTLLSAKQPGPVEMEFLTKIAVNANFSFGRNWD